MSSAGFRLIRSGRVSNEVLVHIDGRVQQGAAPPPSDPADIAATEEAADIVESARMRAFEIIRHANDEAVELRQAAYERGLREGYSEGTASARAELADTLAVVQAAALEGKAVRDSVVRSAEAELIEVVIAALGRVLGEGPHLDRTFVAQCVAHAIERSGAQNVVRVRVNPGDEPIVRAALEERGGPATEWQVLPDGRITVGGCIIDTHAGEVDARLDAQLEEVANALRAAVPHVD